jgi:hypothetical protein
MKQLSSMMVGLQHAADADAAGQVHARADLRTGTHRGPGIDHAAGADIGADVHVARHQHGVLRDVRTAAYQCSGHHACTEILQFGVVAMSEAQRHLVERLRRAAIDHAIVIEAEVQQHRLLDPLVHRPAAMAIRFGDAAFAGFEQVDDLADGRPQVGLDLGLGQFVAPLEGGVDQGFNGLHGTIHRLKSDGRQQLATKSTRWRYGFDAAVEFIGL